MRKYILTTIPILISITSFTQIKIEKYYDAKWKECKPEDNPIFYSLVERKDSLWHRMDYFIQQRTLQMDGYYKDSLEKIKHGKFKYFYANGNMETEEIYFNNVHEGILLSYHPNGMMSDSINYRNGIMIGANASWDAHGNVQSQTILDSNGLGNGVQLIFNENDSISAKGRYVGMKRNGIWNFYHHNGKKSADVIYKMDSIISYKCYNEDGNEQVNCSLKAKPAEFPGGSQKLKEYWNKRVYFPSHLQFTNGKRGLVVVEFTIDITGKVADIIVLQSLHRDFDNIAVKAIKNMPIWSPAIKFNRKVPYRAKQSFTFNQEVE